MDLVTYVWKHFIEKSLKEFTLKLFKHYYMNLPGSIIVATSHAPDELPDVHKRAWYTISLNPEHCTSNSINLKFSFIT